MALFTDHYLVIDYGSSYIKGALYQTGPGGTQILRLESLPVVSIASEDKLQYEALVKARVETAASEYGQNSQEEIDEEIQEDEVVEHAEESTVLQPELLGEYEYNLVRYVLSFFPEHHNFLINVPLEKIYVRDLTIPVTNIKQLDEIIPFEVENLIPVALEDVEVLGIPWSFEEESAKVVSFSVERETLSDLVKPLQRSGTAIKMLSVDAVGLSGFIKLLPEDEYLDKVVAQIDIGGDYTIFNVIKNGNLVFTRKISMGGSDITHIVSEELGITQEAAEQRKIELNLDLAMLNDNLEKEESFYKRIRIEPGHYQILLHKMDKLLKELVSELERSVLSLPCESPVVFFLSGGAALHPGLQDYLTSGIGKPVREYPVHLTNGESAAMWATTIGTGAMYQRKSADKLDYLGTVFGQTLRGGELNFSMFSTPIIILLLSAVIFLISLVGSVFLDKKQIKSNLAELVKISKTIPGVNRKSQNYKSILKNIKQICRTRLRSAGSNDSADSVLSILNDITKYTPERQELDFKLRQFSYDGQSVKFEAEVKKYEDTSKLIAALKKSPLFFGIKLADNRRAYNQKVIRITVQMKINKQSAAASASCK